MIKKERQRNIFYGILRCSLVWCCFLLLVVPHCKSIYPALLVVMKNILAMFPSKRRNDTDSYFIQGYETTVNVTLKSRNRIQLNAEKNDETRNFRA